MSQASVEIVQGHLDAFRANDAAGAVSFLDINVVADMSRMGGVERPVSRGREELIEGMRSYIGAFDDYEYGVEHVTDLGSGAMRGFAGLFVELRLRSRGPSRAPPRTRSPRRPRCSSASLR